MMQHANLTGGCSGCCLVRFGYLDTCVSKQVLCKRGRGAVRVLQANLSKEGAEAEAKANSSSIQRILEVIVFLVFRP